MQDHNALLMTTEDGNLGLAVIQQSKLVLWSREGPARLESRKENTGWAQSKVIELGASLPINVLLGSARLVGFVHGIVVILVRTVGRLFAIDLKSSRVRDIGKGLNLHGYHVIPFVSFCILGTIECFNIKSFQLITKKMFTMMYVLKKQE